MTKATDLATVQKLARGPKGALKRAPESRRLLQNVSAKKSKDMVAALRKLVEAGEGVVTTMPRDHHWQAGLSVLDEAALALARIGTKDALAFVACQLGRDHGQAAAVYATIAANPAAAYDRLSPNFTDEDGGLCPGPILEHSYRVLQMGKTALLDPTRMEPSRERWADADPRWLQTVKTLVEGYDRKTSGRDWGKATFSALRALAAFHREEAEDFVVELIGEVDIPTLAGVLPHLQHRRAEASRKLLAERDGYLSRGAAEIDGEAGESELQQLDWLVAQLQTPG